MNRLDRSRLGGAALIVAAVGFVLVFSWLASAFGYPEVLDGDAERVLPQLLALGTTGRAVWTIYALLPLLLIPAALGASARWRDVAPTAARWSVALALAAAMTMLTGLVRWPTIHWTMAERWADATPAARDSMTALFIDLNRYLGNVIGEFIGELALSGFFIATARAMQLDGTRWWLWISGYAMGVLGFVGALRNVFPLTQGASTVNNMTLPIWLIVLGAVMLRRRVA